MIKSRFALNIFAFTLFTLTVSIVTQAQSRTWVSGVGDDLNPCSRTAPCKTYAGAISKTSKDGEISTLDPGGFGTVTITKSITINGGNGGQGYGSIIAALQTGVIINITDAGDVRKSVRLDWLNINGVSTGTDGIRFVAGSALHVSNTLIDGFTSDGIEVTSSNSTVVVENTQVRNCVGTGMRTNGTVGGGIKASVIDSYFTRNGVGLNFQNGTIANVHDCTVNNNTSHGLQVGEPTAGSSLSVSSTNIASNAGTGINVLNTSRARIARCNIFNNNVSLAPNNLVDSGGNNNIAGNTTNTAPSGGFPFTEN